MITMKGENKYKRALLIISQLYKKDYSFEGMLLSKKDMYDLYVKTLRKSAYLGYPLAQYDYAQLYENINFGGLNQNYSPKKCIYWYKKACMSNIPAAFNNLAGFYENGEGVEKDMNRALELYKKAMELGDSNGRGNYRILLKQMKAVSTL